MKKILVLLFAFLLIISSGLATECGEYDYDDETTNGAGSGGGSGGGGGTSSSGDSGSGSGGNTGSSGDSTSSSGDTGSEGTRDCHTTRCFYFEVIVKSNQNQKPIEGVNVHVHGDYEDVLGWDDASGTTDSDGKVNIVLGTDGSNLADVKITCSVTGFKTTTKEIRKVSGSDIKVTLYLPPEEAISEECTPGEYKCWGKNLCKCVVKDGKAIWETVYECPSHCHTDSACYWYENEYYNETGEGPQRGICCW